MFKKFSQHYKDIVDYLYYRRNRIILLFSVVSPMDYLKKLDETVFNCKVVTWYFVNCKQLVNTSIRRRTDDV